MKDYRHEAEKFLQGIQEVITSPHLLNQSQLTGVLIAATAAQACATLHLADVTADRGGTPR